MSRKFLLYQEIDYSPMINECHGLLIVIEKYMSHRAKKQIHFS